MKAGLWFNRAVETFFVPIARKAGSKLERNSNNSYDIISNVFVIRIRRGTGHHEDILVTLMPRERHSKQDADDLTDNGEIGLGVVMGFTGNKEPAPIYCTEAEYFDYIAKMAVATETFLLPCISKSAPT